MIPRWFRALQLAREHSEPRQRVVRYFDCRWQSAFGQERSRISSLSPTGCYIEERRSVPARGETVQDIRVDLPTGPISVDGTVLDRMPGIGFAVRFTAVDAEARARLTAFVREVREQSSLQ